MSEQKKSPSDLVQPLANQALNSAAIKWRNLIERRRAHFIDLYLTGRWKHYYSEEQFQARFRDAMSVADRWTEIAPKPDNDNTGAPAPANTEQPAS
ncbi:MAG TPA: hypothetical protein VMH84_02825 [Xanthobacteraceae bacterium]|nr:hypothetical protein [Xanthobacteraceae bacterium]